METYAIGLKQKNLFLISSRNRHNILYCMCVSGQGVEFSPLILARGRHTSQCFGDLACATKVCVRVREGGREGGRADIRLITDTASLTCYVQQ